MKTIGNVVNNDCCVCNLFWLHMNCWRPEVDTKVEGNRTKPKVIRAKKKKMKATLCSIRVLHHYNPNAGLVLQADASSVGVGAVLLRPSQDGEWEPVAYVSRTLGDVEKNYSRIVKESLGIVFGVTKFRQYLLWRHFTLTTDHKPLVTV